MTAEIYGRALAQFAASVCDKILLESESLFAAGAFVGPCSDQASPILLEMSSNLYLLVEPLITRGASLRILFAPPLLLVGHEALVPGPID